MKNRSKEFLYFIHFLFPKIISGHYKHDNLRGSIVGMFWDVIYQRALCLASETCESQPCL